MYRRLQCTSSNSYDVSWWKKIPFCHIIRNITPSFFFWCSTCQRWWRSLSLIELFFNFFLSSPENYKLVRFVVDILTLVIIFLIFKFLLDLYIKVLFVFNFIIQSQLSCFFFSILSLFFWFLISFSWLFCKVLLVFNFIFQSKFILYYFFQLNSYFFHFILLKLFF